MESQTLKGLLLLLNARKKRDAERAARDLVITKDLLANFVLAARLGGVAPLEYFCHFDEIVPDHLPPKSDDLSALASNGVGPLGPAAAKTLRKVIQIFRDRSLFSVHLLFEPPGRYWHLFYFNQRDYAAADNHWQHGSHIHYSSDLISQQPLQEVWSGIRQRPPVTPPSLHIRFIDSRTREGNDAYLPSDSAGSSFAPTKWPRFSGGMSHRRGTS